MLNQYSSDIRPLGGWGVAELARETGVTPATVRYYARVGLLSPTRNPNNGYRCFSGADLRRLRFVRQAQALGLTIRDIKALLEATDRGENICDMVRSRVSERLQNIRQQVDDLEQTQALANRALAACATTPSLTLKPGELYPLIERHTTNRPVRTEGSRAHAPSFR